jgi:hypothetical protein
MPIGLAYGPQVFADGYDVEGTLAVVGYRESLLPHAWQVSFIEEQYIGILRPQLGATHDQGGQIANGSTHDRECELTAFHLTFENLVHGEADVSEDESPTLVPVRMGIENLADDDRTIACGQFVQTSAYQRRRARLRGNAKGENAT